MEIKNLLPHEIESRSFEIISAELGNIKLDLEEEPIIKRVIHTSADFDYIDNLKFSKDAIKKAKEAIKKGVTIVTDTNMAKAGINKSKLAKLGGSVECFIANEDVALNAKENGITRAIASMEKASTIKGPVIFAIGNAPTALIKLYELLNQKKINPYLIIGVPVGFVNVVESKELIMSSDIEYIVARGRKGGSNIAAAICNAIIYQIPTIAKTPASLGDE